MNTRALSTAFLLGLLALGATACGGAGEAAVLDAGGAQDPPPTPGEPPPAPAPTDDPLDTQLLARLAQRNIRTVPEPPDHPSARVELGRALFFDKELSGNRNIACATCHHPTTGTGDDLSLPIGEGGTGLGAARQLGSGALIPRNAPPLFNRGLPSVRRMFWDSRVSLTGGGALNTPEPALNGVGPQAAAIASELTSALAAQAIFPLTAHDEMRGMAGENELADASSNLEVWERVMVRLVGTENGTVGGIPAYRDLLRTAYPEVVDFDAFHIGHVGRALAAFQDQAFRALQSPFDAYLAGDRTSMSDEAKRGALLFYGRADCSRCHEGPLQTDDAHHAIAIPQLGPGREADGDDLGRFEQTGDADDLYAFRTPTLRNVEITGPWMHDGAYTSLAAAVRHYDNPVRSLLQYDAQQLSPLLRSLVDRDPDRNQARADALSNILRPAPNLNNGDIATLVAFLEALTDPSSLALAGVVPAAVPSGLPVSD